MDQITSMRHGFRPTMKLAGNLTSFSAILTLKADDPDVGARAIAAIICEPGFAEALSRRGVVHHLSVTRIDRNRLLFQASYDGDLVTGLERLQDLDVPLREILSLFEGAPGAGAAFSDWLAFIAAGQVDIVTYYSGYPKLTVAQIRRNADWRRKIVEMQKSLVRPAGRVAWRQSASGI